MAITTSAANGTTKMPVKTREVQNHHMDSQVWNNLPLRSDDIVILTYGKSDTTWVQQIVGQLTHQGDASLAPNLVSPWVDLRRFPKEVMHGMLAAQTHRRFMKSHLPLDALVRNPDVKYIFIARDGRDMVWSTHHHFTNATPAFWHLINETPGRAGLPYQPPSSANPRDLLVDLVEDDSRGSLPWPFWSHTRQWWEARDQPNLLLVHFNDLKKDLAGEMRRIADFLEVPQMSEQQWADAVEHCTFQWMKEHAEMSSPPQADQSITSAR
ncbi:P-loop containing nucleoside triphosphate hydrolase protein [Microdochium trichocladiopsis]|uniref:P-loop containing nucleoside triphosphate hydrolase protein n=1 Tax=Microdochium trichocladiopsis TaxID=1682393 RepID=A0A9P9BXC9_9PEZI|nr:P-loop containing nucleoside triphosphate hydrolase protein [Microdochium trichocladiopsis]KAH7035956.1 P-loop containing nucleoside triphosphate hydrolase protein [Microdochium trichocladiopsis]